MSMRATTTTSIPLPHGGDLAEACRLFPKAPFPWIDLSTGINPWAYRLPPVSPEIWTCLPSLHALAGLERLAKHYYGASEDTHVAAVPGTQAAIQWLPRLFEPGEVAILGPTYGEHEQSWALAGHQIIRATGLATCESAPVAIVVNPNNPDGSFIDPESLARLAADKQRRGGALIVDEAFADVATPISLAAHKTMNGLIILRSFGKFFGLAGIRLGFVLGHPDTINPLRRAIGPWAVSGEAIAIGGAALADVKWQEATRQKLAEEREKLDKLLAPAGKIIGGTNLFRLLETPDAPALFERLGNAGIWVRRFPYNPHWLRFGLLPDKAAAARLEEALTTDKAAAARLRKY